MAKYMGRVDGYSNAVALEYPVADGVTVHEGDFVYLAGNGRVTNAAIADKALLGYSLGVNTQDLADSTTTATGDTAGTVKVLVVVEPTARYLVEAGASLTAADVGNYYDLTGAAGNQTISAASKNAGGGQFLLTRLAEGIQGSADTHGVFTIARSQLRTGDKVA